jgi:hypothetical protein
LKVFVDDLRDCPKGWQVARTITEAIRILSTQPVEEVSLDHDIMAHVNVASEETFEPVARYLAVLNSILELNNQIKVRIHTSNTTAGKVMADILGIEYNYKIYDLKDYE